MTNTENLLDKGIKIQYELTTTLTVNPAAPSVQANSSALANENFTLTFQGLRYASYCYYGIVPSLEG